jgi:cell division septum initiation protein DivIVA
MAGSIDQLKKWFLDQVEADGKAFLDANAGSRDFIEERGQRLATLGITYVASSDAESQERVLGQMEEVRQSIENELSVIAVNASAAARAEFMKVVNHLVTVLQTVLPIAKAILLA